MPNCRHCGSRIEKFNKDRCPICGETHPLDGISSDTIEITTSLVNGSLEFEDLKQKKKMVFLVLFVLLGWLGIPFLYLKDYKRTIISFVSHILFMAILFCLLFLLLKVSLLLSIIIIIGAIYLIDLLLTLIFHYTTIKDGYGNIVK